MVTVCVCGAGKDSAEVAAIKKALPGAEVLVQGEDAAVFFLLADHLRAELKELGRDGCGPDEDMVRKLDDKKLCEYMQDEYEGAFADAFWSGVKEDAAEGRFDNGGDE